MNRALVDRERGFLHRLRQGRMRVAGARDVFRCRAEFHRDRSFRDHVAGIGADDMNPKHAIGFGIRENFSQSLRSAGWPWRGHSQ